MLSVFKKIDVAIAANFVIIALLAVYLSDGIAKFSLIYFKYNLHLSKIIKSLLIGYLFYWQIRQRHYFSSILILMFVVGQAFIADSFSDNSLVIFTKYLFTVSYLIYFTKTNLSETTQKRFIRSFEWILIINSLLILIGWVFEVSFLRTYAGHRFGYNGLFLNSSTGSYVYIFALFYFLIRYKKTFFLNVNTWLILGCCLLLGTKASILGVFIAFLTYILFFLKKTHRIIAVTGALILSFGSFYYLFFHAKLFNSIRLKEGLFTAIFSFRNENLKELTFTYISEQWSLVNYLFGGVSDFATRAQFGFLDELYFFGFVGAGYYFMIQYKSIKNIINIKLFKYLLIGLSIVILLAGNFFPYPSIVVYFTGLIYVMKLEVQTKTTY